MAKALTALAVENAKATTKRREIPDGLMRGLFLIVQPSGARSWAYRYRATDGKTRKLTLGPFPALDLKAARQKAGEAATANANDIDPARAKQVVKAAARKARAPVDQSILVENVIASFIERHVLPNNRAATAREAERTLGREVEGRWRGRHIADVTRGDVQAMLDEMVDRGSPAMANRTLAVVRKFFGWAADRGLVVVSPCASLKAPSATRSRDRVLSDDELRRVWRACDDLGYPFGPMVKLLILTAQRRDEVAGLVRRELDLDQASWVLPRSRAKNNVEHVVPLCLPAVAILNSLPGISTGKAEQGADFQEFLFTTTGRSHVTGFSKAKLMLDRRLAGDGGADVPHWTFHDLRRTAATGMARLGTALPVVEKILNHVSGSFGGVAGVYQRHDFRDEKRQALNAWGGFIINITASLASNTRV